MRGEEELPHLCTILNKLDNTAGGVVDGVAPPDIQFLRIVDQDESKATNSICGMKKPRWRMYWTSLKFLNVCQVKHSSRGDVLHPEHVQRDEVESVVP